MKNKNNSQKLSNERAEMQNKENQEYLKKNINSIRI